MGDSPRGGPRTQSRLASTRRPRGAHVVRSAVKPLKEVNRRRKDRKEGKEPARRASQTPRGRERKHVAQSSGGTAHVPPRTRRFVRLILDDPPRKQKVADREHAPPGCQYRPARSWPSHAARQPDSPAASAAAGVRRPCGAAVARSHRRSRGRAALSSNRPRSTTPARSRRRRFRRRPGRRRRPRR